MNHRLLADPRRQRTARYRAFALAADCFTLVAYMWLIATVHTSPTPWLTWIFAVLCGALHLACWDYLFTTRKHT